MKNGRRGFTLIEMLVVVAIIGILVFLLLPAVQAAREAARRAQCQNNLMQLGLALRNYYLAHGSLPPGVQDPTSPVQNIEQGQHLGWLVHLLPYIEQSPAFEQIDLSLGAYDKRNQAVRNLKISTFQCPSSYEGGTPTVAWSSYAGCHHDVEAPISIDNNGVLFQNSRVRYDDIADGRSHTIFAGERRTDELEDGARDIFDAQGRRLGDLGWTSGTRWTLRNTGTPINQTTKEPKERYDSFLMMNDFGQGLSFEAGMDPLGGESPPGMAAPAAPEAAAPAAPDAVAPAEAGQFPLAVDQPEPQPVAPAATGPTVKNPLWVGGFESLHIGGAQFVFGDGSVRYLSERIHPDVYRQLGHRSDGLLLDSSVFGTR